MKFKFILLVALVLGAIGVNAQSIRSFESMGYEDAAITGINGSLTYFIKVKPDDDVNKSRLILNFSASQVLNPNSSFIVVSIKDLPVYTQRISVSPTDTLFRIEVPLNQSEVQPDGRYIKVKISASMSIHEEQCRDIDNICLWVSVKNSSYVNVVSQDIVGYQRSLKEWIQEFTSVYTPAVADLNDMTSGGVLYTILKQATQKEIYTGVYTSSDSLPYGVVTGVAEKLPYSVRQVIPSMGKGQGLISLARVNTGLGLRTIMLVTGADVEGYKKAINALTSNKRLNSTFSEKMLIDEAVPSYANIENKSPLITSLESLGATPSLMEGIGSLKSKYIFSLTEFNAIPTKLTFHLESYFSNLRQDDRGFINVYLNQNLVYSSNLVNRTSFIEDIDLKPYMLSKFNTLEVEFRFHPYTKACESGFSSFFAFTNVKTSTLTFVGEQENKFYSFFNFPAEFRKVPTKIVVSPMLYNSNIISSIGELFYQLNAPFNPNYSRIIVPPLVSADKTTMDDLKGFNVIALLNKNDKFVDNFKQLPVNFKKDFQLYKDDQGKLTYEINDFSNSGLAEIFKERGSTVLMVTSLGGDSANKSAFESVVKNFSTQLTEIESNVCIANSGGKSNYFFKLPEDNDLVTYRGETNGFQVFYEKYKWILLGLLLVLVLLAFLFVRNKVKESQETFKEL